MLTRYIALVSQSANVKSRQLMSVAATLQKQVIRDFGPIWDIDATVDPFESLEDVPLGHWPIIVADDINTAGATGIHEDRKGQPFALVQASPLWSITASHECLEILADPSGRRTVGGFAFQKMPSKKASSTKMYKVPVEFLVEVCDPCEDFVYAYQIDGIPVSDFYTPEYFDSNQNPAVRYDFAGHINRPREVLKNGYLSWYDPALRKWMQHTNFGVEKIEPVRGIEKHRVITREIVDRLTPTPLEEMISQMVAHPPKKGSSVGTPFLFKRSFQNSRFQKWLTASCTPQVFCSPPGRVLAVSFKANRVLADGSDPQVWRALIGDVSSTDIGRLHDAKDLQEDIDAAKRPE